ncbi:hypothetical protein HNY42_07205 [Exiguobacterium sp. Helios]|uniref:hypothetical protein n=1 Tax=Exiguobacterium sp. Helios TaxID=2735868 RepID=UPI00104C59E6|nr:hypothetical protein [Exiguobacterium sp. Helios]QNR20734.1 hypothetical protein HNY42_07205 [Exiguobacterium sp. Helios]
MSDKKYTYLIEEIEKLKFHNRTLLTLLGNLNPDALENTTIHEAVILFDLSKNDLRELKDLIIHYDRNRFVFEQKALMINPVLSTDNLLFLVKSFVNSEMLTAIGNTILTDYEVKAN